MMRLPRALPAGLAALLLALALLADAFTASAAWAQDFVGVPPLQTRVTDKIGMLTENQRNTLENVLKEYEERSGAQIAILLMASTAPETIEQYSIRVADAWKLGRKGIDDGVLLIVAKDNPPGLRRLRIEAFRGVQGSLTDAQSKRIIDEVIAPHFRQNDFYGGLSAAVSAIISLLDAEQLPAPPQAANTPAAAEEGDFSLGMFLFVLFLFILMSRRRRRRYHRHGWGRSIPGVILGGAIGHGMGRGGFGGGGFGSGGFGGSFGGGGFSGGGGGADGGGASGNW